MSLGEVIKVLRNLLREGVSIRDLRTILEALADHAGAIKDPDELTELVRQRLRAGSSPRAPRRDSGELRAAGPRPARRGRCSATAAATPTRRRSPASPTTSTSAARALVERDEPPLLVVAPDVRRAVAGDRAPPRRRASSVMSYREVDPSVPFVTRGVVSAQEAAS